MNVTVRIPDALAHRLESRGDIARQALEALGIEAFRAGRLTSPELRALLGFGTRMALDAFLKAHGIHTDDRVADLDAARCDLDRLGL